MLPENCPDLYTLGGEIFHHVIRVLRYKAGKKLEGLDRTGRKYAVTILEIRDEDCLLQVKRTADKIQMPEIILYQCIPKAKKIETIIRCVTELGVNRIVPMHSEHTIPPLPDPKKLDRWSKICTEALQQCGSGVYTEVAPPIDLKNIPAVKTGEAGVVFPFSNKYKTRQFSINLFDNLNNLVHILTICHTDIKNIPAVKRGEAGVVFHQTAEKGPSLKSLLESNPSAISFLIGPEGGFSENEIATLDKKGYISVLMVHNVLKVDTAAIAAAGIIQNILMEKEN